MTICHSIPTLSIDITLFSTPITKAPTTAPTIVPTPPEAEAPPIKQAAIASSSNIFPASGEEALKRAGEYNAR